MVERKNKKKEKKSMAEIVHDAEILLKSKETTEITKADFDRSLLKVIKGGKIKKD